MAASKKRVRLKVDFSPDEVAKIKLVAKMRQETFEECVLHLLHEQLSYLKNGV